MVFIHPQAEWETRTQPIGGPAPKGTPGTWVIHYPGSPSLFETDDRHPDGVVPSLHAAVICEWAGL